MSDKDEAKLKLVERVTVRKFDKTLEDDPKEPCEEITQETVTEISMADAMLLGWTPKEPDAPAEKPEGA